MTLEDLKKLVAKYKAELASFGREPIRMNIRQTVKDVIPVRFEDHLLWMCEHIEKNLIPEGKIEKSHRWLGFIQCGMSYLGMYTIEDLRSHDSVQEIP